MKNKTERFFVKIACLLFAFGAATFSAACENSDNGAINGQQGGKTETQTSLVQLISSFENKDEYYKFGASSRFGKLSQNIDKSYVTEGEASLKIEAYGDYSAGGTPPTAKLALSAEGYADLSKFKSVTFDIFNVAETSQEIRVSLTIDGFSAKEQTFSLQTGKNSVTYSPVVKYLSVASDLSKGETLNITFPAADKTDQTPKVFYLDNVRLNSHFKAFEPVKMTLDEGEFCSFDKEYQEYVVTSIGVGPCTGCLPELTVNADPAYTKNGQGKSLKAVLPTGTAPLGDGWPGIYFISPFLEKIDFAAYAKAEKELVFDVYNTSGSYNFAVEIWGKNRKTTANYGKSFTANRGWTEVRIPLKDLDNKVTEIKPDKLSENVDSLAITYGKFAGADKTLYFDNFRIE